MRRLHLIGLTSILLLGCSADDSNVDVDSGIDASTDVVVADVKADTTVKPDAAPDAAADAAKEATVDAMPPEAGNDAAVDASDGGLAPPGSPCSPPNVVQDEPCGLCGTHYRGCFADGDGGYTWGDWGFCQNQVINGCDPKVSYPDLSCGNCGTKKQVCLSNCNFDATQQCTEPSGACAPGSTEFKVGLSCDGGGRERVCSNQCSWQNWGSCVGGITPLFNRLAGGYYHTCGINNAGVVKCWGYNTYGQLGNNATSSSSVPVTVNGSLTNPVSIGAGYAHSCATLQSGATYCWGYNTYGQIGDGTTTNRGVPTPVTGIANALRVDGGYYHSCALINDGTVKCWGYNTYGQLGNGSTSSSSLPVVASGLSNVTDAQGGLYYHSCALINDGTVKCWGYNTYGELGNGNTSSQSTAITVTGITTATSISTGYYHTCALLQGGALACWGYNSYGQLGNGNTTTSYVPVIATESNLVAVSVGYAHTCVLTLGGEVKCAGYNTYGQLGNGTTANSSTFVTAISSGARSIASGNYHTCALMSGGDVKCWGYNSDGQLGDGTTTNRSTPVSVTGF